MKAVLPKQIGDKIEGRANSKGATVKGRHYVIGGLSQQGPETGIYSFIITKRDPYQIEWRKQQVKNIELFILRHSFSVATFGSDIYIFGGDDMSTGQSIRGLLMYSTSTNVLSKVETKGDIPPAMHSMTLVADQNNNQLVLFGGASSEGKIPLRLYSLDLTSLTWKFKELNLECYDQGIWQHTVHLVTKPLVINSNINKDLKTKKQNIIGLDLGIKQSQEKTLAHKIAKVTIGEENIEKQIEEKAEPQAKSQEEQKAQLKGPFLVIVGGCSHPNHPYSQVTQLDITTGQIVSQAFINSITGHQSVLHNGNILVFGGSDGTAPTQTIVYAGEKTSEEKGFVGIGPIGFDDEKEVIIFGGINVSTMPPTFNSVMVLYDA